MNQIFVIDHTNFKIFIYLFIYLKCNKRRQKIPINIPAFNSEVKKHIFPTIISVIGLLGMHKYLLGLFV